MVKSIISFHIRIPYMIRKLSRCDASERSSHLRSVNNQWVHIAALPSSCEWGQHAMPLKPGKIILQKSAVGSKYTDSNSAYTSKHNRVHLSDNSKKERK
jgi:hypothetical protein